MHFDPSGLYSAFDKMRDNAASQGKTLGEQMGGIFLKDIKSEGWKEAPTPEELNAVAMRLKGRLKRKRGVTPMKELQRRIRARGTFARNWKIEKIQSEKYIMRIWLRDSAASSGKVDSEKGVSNRAEKITGRAFKTKLDAMADKLTNSFR